MHKLFYLAFSFIISASVFAQDRVITGAENLLSDQLDLIKNKNLGIITNHSAILNNGTHLVDSLNKIPGIKIKALFGPEHGIRGNAPDGKSIQTSVDEKIGVPVYSLYGKINKPSKEMLEGIDLLIFDIQDVGARFYTFISTLYYCIETSAENNIPLIVLDRPNPIGGLYIDGPIRDEKSKSFVGIIPIPITHAMTVGEIANMINEEMWTSAKSKSDLKIIKMKNWKREYLFDDCGLRWIKPSPNIPNLETAIIYPGICLIEGTNISEGRGTYSPFMQIGAPFIKSHELLDAMTSSYYGGIKIDTVSFTPVSIPNMSDNPKYKGEKCFGLKLRIIDKHKFEPVKFGVSLIYALNKLYPDKFEFRKGIARLYGKTDFEEKIKSNVKPIDIFNGWNQEIESFKSIREKYLLY